MDRQFTDHAPLMACACGRRPHMYQRKADRAECYFVECTPCNVRTALAANPEAAATAWCDGERVTITSTATDVA
jgi:hypothetical protein